MSYPQCIVCKWYKGVGCKAYPKSIPQEILDNEIDHRKPYNGDRGIVFQLKDIRLKKEEDLDNYISKSLKKYK